jgi:hypothetical protein
VRSIGILSSVDALYEPRKTRILCLLFRYPTTSPAQREYEHERFAQELSGRGNDTIRYTRRVATIAMMVPRKGQCFPAFAGFPFRSSPSSLLLKFGLLQAPQFGPNF